MLKKITPENIRVMGFQEADDCVFLTPIIEGKSTPEKLRISKSLFNAIRRSDRLMRKTACLRYNSPIIRAEFNLQTA